MPGCGNISTGDGDSATDTAARSWTAARDTWSGCYSAGGWRFWIFTPSLPGFAVSLRISLPRWISRGMAIPIPAGLPKFIENPKRGLVSFCPKWATDQDPDSRLACVIKRSESPELFLSLYGHIGIMDDASHSRSLDDLLLAVGGKSFKNLTQRGGDEG